MSRGAAKIKHHKLLPDQKYGSTLVTKFINYIMENGKKTIAEKIVYSALEDSSKKINVEPVLVLDQIIKNIGPILEVKAKRIGGANYQVPMEVNAKRKETLAFRWVIKAAQSRKGVKMATKLTQEIIDACNGVGAAVKKKEDMHRMAEANKAFAHFARF
ncbi:MAG: small subunit ribosomal protein S7 [Candidatus Berkelbacteria bacterium Athens1014_28]|uniref:Small ribosomal subunit protein uS7 n=1 Tax=Candidatus Berkelbacteria bacterium Athens1014_28 TaxID=2017145 RepID=A0A554LN33_9BACT|nr:MAG: small subunit ribosomal protein S7 [Candidatus Berkelbacteria bacterium Athens1014_28]